MITGKGFLKGTQNALAFLPEQHTDFILSVLAEEWGLVGCTVLLVLYFLLICWGLNVAYNCRNLFGSILAFGITSMVFWQIFINIGMVMGLMPVVGMPCLWYPMGVFGDHQHGGVRCFTQYQHAPVLHQLIRWCANGSMPANVGNIF